MSIHFNKMQGAGNSYIYITSTTPQLDKDAIQLMCHPHYGVGGDGVVVLYPTDTADIAMAMYNKDGTRGAICGNALRCVAKLLYHQQPQPSYNILSDSGTITVDCIDSNHYRVHMPAVTLTGKIDSSPHTPLGILHTVHCGNSHAVVIGNVSADKLCQYMPILNSHYLHQQYNVEVAYIQDRSNVTVTVYERGSGITLSCGSGAVATMALLHQMQLVDDLCHIHMTGGTLTVQYTDCHYTLSGDAVIVFSGDIL